MGALLRYQLFLGIGVLILSIWLAIFLNESYSNSNPIVTFAPLWICVALAAYAFLSIAYGVIICKDFPAAAREIEEQVKEAKVEMKRRGIGEGN
jgi:predicted membrane protein